MYLMSRRSLLATFPVCTRGIDADAFFEAEVAAAAASASSPLVRFFVFDSPLFRLFFSPFALIPSNPASISSALASQNVSAAETSQRYSWLYDR